MTPLNSASLVSDIPAIVASVSTSQDERPARKKRSRGRPLKEVGQSNVPEERRAQVRKAQEAFRQRKQAAIRSLEQRAVVLEDCVEEISKVFLSFSDSMLKTELLKKNPEIGEELLATTAKIVELARLAIPEDQDEDQDQQPCTSDTITDITSSSKDLPPARRSSTPCSSSCSKNERPSPITLFGNGWFGYTPSYRSHYSHQPSIASSTSSTIPTGSFSTRLVHQNLLVAYQTLLADPHFEHPLVFQIFQHALHHHTREELLAGLRWFLSAGPGSPPQRALGRAVFGFDTSLALQHLNLGNSNGANESGIWYEKPRVLNPLVDAEAILGVGSRCFDLGMWGIERPFLNACEIEEYLVERGAEALDEDVIVLRQGLEEKGDGMCGDLALESPTVVGVESGIDGSKKIGAIPTDNGTEYQNTQKFTPTKASSEGKHCELFDFNALLKDSDHQSTIQGTQIRHETDHPEQPEQEKEILVKISVPLLIDNLLNNSICLGTGPGYPRCAVDTAIRMSTFKAMSVGGIAS